MRWFDTFCLRASPLLSCPDGDNAYLGRFYFLDGPIPSNMDLPSEQENGSYISAGSRTFEQEAKMRTYMVRRWFGFMLCWPISPSGK